MSATAWTGADPLLRVENVSVSLAGHQVLHRVNLALEPGEFTGLIGSNGAGKTTLLRVILNLTPPTSGRVLFNGRPRSRRNSLMGYVPQKISLDPDVPLRARDLVGLGIDGNHLGLPWPSRLRRNQVDEMLKAVDATTFANARVGNLSGGELQRVLIAHALISNPPLLLLDEPLANLDIRSEQEIVDLLARIAREQQVAILISTHDVNPLLAVMDRVAYVAAGRIASGTVADVISTEALSRLYGHHVDVIHVHDRVIVVAGPADAPLQHAGPEPVVRVL